MFLDEKEIVAIAQNKWELECAEIRLIQNSMHNPIQYFGSGSIYQDTDGRLKVKVYHVYQGGNELIREVNRQQNSSTIPGKLLPNNEYFSLLAKDMKGREWVADKILVPYGYSTPAVGKVVIANISTLEFKSERYPHEDVSKTYIIAHVKGKYELPYNELEKIESNFSNSSSLNICNLSINNEKYMIHQREGYISITFECLPENDIEKRFKLFLEALGIGIGKYLKPMFVSKTEGKNRFLTVFSQQTHRKEFLPNPIPVQIHRPQELNRFVARYLATMSEPYSSYYGYWYRILRGFSGELENRALVITTAIEGILKEYFSDYGNPDEEFSMQVEKALPLVKDLLIGQRVKDRICSTLGQAQSKTAKNKLYNLEKEGIISKHMVETWAESRNKATHADSLNMDDLEVQLHLDQSYSCLALFYKLLFTTLGYRGGFIDYTQDGWPTKPN